MNRRYDPIALTIMSAAIVLAVVQWIVVARGVGFLPSAFEFLQTWVLITAAILYTGYLAFRGSRGIADGIRRFFTQPFTLTVPITILAYLSTTWFGGFNEKFSNAAWHSGVALKGFWLGAIAQSHGPFPSVAYSFWANLLQFMVDHTVYSWFGYVVIGVEAVIALAFITAVAALVVRPYLMVGAGAALLALLFHFFFLMSGSAGVNALMPYLTGIAAVCLIATAVTAYLPKEEARPPIILEPIATREKVPTNGHVPSQPVGTGK